MMTRALLGSAAALLLLATALPVRADDAKDDAAAVALFQEAKKLVGAGDYEHACPKFAEAQRLSPTTGTLLNLGDCYEHVGKMASAWGAFKRAEISARNARENDRRGEAVRRAQAIEGKLSKLTIAVAGAPGSGIEVRRDGELVGEGQWGTAMPVDPGEHAIEVKAPKRQTWSTSVVVASGGVSVAVNVPELAMERTEDKAAVGSLWSAQRIAGIAVGGVGLVGIAVGAVLGGIAIAKNSASKANCDTSDPRLCSPAGADARLAAGGMADASTAMFIVGGVAVATGLTVLLTARKGGEHKPKVGGLRWLEAAPLVGAGTAGLTLGAGW